MDQRSPQPVATIIALPLVLALAAPAAAQERSARSWRDAVAAAHADTHAREPVDPNTFGTSSSVDHWIVATEFMPGESGATFVFLQPGYLGRTSSFGSDYFAQLNLPAGALLQELKLYYYDVDNGTENVKLDFCRLWSNADGTTSPSDFSCTEVQNSGMPGYSALTMNVNQTIRYRQNEDADPEPEDVAYLVFVELPTFDSDPSNPPDASTQFKGVRALYKRQISPAPLVATFTDVPTTSSQFQFVEALFAAGITAGSSCPPTPTPSYCPQNPVTRGQMAVFLARLGGLHFPN